MISRDVPPVEMRTNAKLNLFLRVVGRRPDGYHELESIFHSVDLFDTVSLERLDGPTIEVRMQMIPELPDAVPSAKDNIVTAVVNEVAVRTDETRTGLRVDIVKQIPLGSGLGGGSGNAAGALSAVNELWALGLDPETLAAIGARIGADVPFCLSGGTALVLGRGEELTALPAPTAMDFVLGLSFEPLSTAGVYEAWDRLGDTGDASRTSAPMALALGSGAPDEVARLLHNDLEAAALSLRPRLADRKQALFDAGALGAGMSGSGPTMFGLARDREHARDVAVRVAGHFDRVVIVRSASKGVERVR